MQHTTAHMKESPLPGKMALVEAVILDKFQGIGAELQQITSGSSSDFQGRFFRHHDGNT